MGMWHFFLKIPRCVDNRRCSEWRRSTPTGCFFMFFLSGSWWNIWMESPWVYRCQPNFNPFQQKSKGLKYIWGSTLLPGMINKMQLRICWIRGLVLSINLGLWDEHSSQYNLLHASKVDYPMKKYLNITPGSYPVAPEAVRSESCNWDLLKHMSHKKTLITFNHYTGWLIVILIKV